MSFHANTSQLNHQLVSLHDELKSLILTASQDFPGPTSRSLNTLEMISELETLIAAYTRSVLLRLFRSGIPPQLKTGDFALLWLDRAKAPKAPLRSETEINLQIQKLAKDICYQTRTTADEDLQTILKDDAEIPKLLYYLTTVQESLGWYSQRYLAKISENAGSERR